MSGDAARTFYLDPTRGWRSSETPEATIRLTSEVRVVSRAHAENRFEARDAQGNWVPARDMPSDPRRVAKFIEVWDIARSGEPLRAFRSPRVVDDELINGALQSRVLRDIDSGEPLAAPLCAGHSFALSIDDAREACSALADAGWKVAERPPDPRSIREAAADICDGADEVCRLADAAREIGRLAGEGAPDVAIEVGRIENELERAHATLRMRMRMAEPLVSRGTDHGVGAEERIVIEREVARIQDAHARADNARTFTRSLARECARRAGDLPTSLATATPGIADALAIVAAHLTAQGVRATITEDGLVVTTPDGVVEIGASVQIHRGPTT